MPRPAGPGPSRVNFALLLAGLAAALVLSVTLAITFGAVSIPAPLAWEIILHRVAPAFFDRAGPTGAGQIVWEIRLPRVLLAALVGAGLSVVGATLQALVRNPLADPYVFGLTSGAAAGATASTLFGASILGIYSQSVAAFLGALVAFAFVFVLAQSSGVLAPTRLILAGVAVSFALSALTSFQVFEATRRGQEDAALLVLFWLLGGLGGAGWDQLLAPTIVVGAGTLYLVLQSRPLNALLVGEESAVGLGVDTRTVRRSLFALCALLTGVMVAVSGGIGFVGLMMPHIVRLLVGSDHRRVLPVAALLGATFLIWADVFARIAYAPQELPIGIVTALAGTPFFIWLLRARGPVGEEGP